MTSGENSPVTGSDPQALYQHVKRKDWGLAIVAWQRDDRRAYQFEDGKLRIFKKGFYNFFQEVDRPLDTSSNLIRELNRKIGVSEARQELVEEASARGKDVYTLKDQIDVFFLEYAGGFDGDTWQAEVRGTDASRALKRHRNQAITQAQELLSKEALDELLAAGEFDDVFKRAVMIADSTDLIAASQVRDVEKLPEEGREAYARALTDLLHGTGPIEDRMDAYVATCPEKTSWQMATVHLGLVHPTNHVVVQPTSFRQQAKWMAPRLKYSSTPTGDIYARFYTMAKAVEDRLERAELKPRDMVDVHDFIRLTMRPRARARIDEVRKARLEVTA